MSAAFTPGPWAVSTNDSSVFGAKRGNGLEPLGYVFTPSFAERSAVGQRAIADLHLIASAPDLFDIAKQLAGLAEGLANGNSAAEEIACRLAERARVVVAKAQGSQA